jgi:hypothetical protein
MPRFAARLAGVYAVAFQGFNGFGVNMASRMTACADRFIFPFSKLVDQGFGHDRSAGVASAENKNPLNH